MLLERFATPGNIMEIPDEDLQAWSKEVSDVIDFLNADFPQLYNPTKVETPEDHQVHPIIWPAVPGRLVRTVPDRRTRWHRADCSRHEQDEYCEWSVTRNTDGEIIRVTFTSETPLYYEHLLNTNENVLLDLYESATGIRPDIDGLKHPSGRYNERNALNISTEGPIVHLAQRTNQLGAALRLAAEATVLRERNGTRVTHAEELVRCGRLGEPLRHSDPQIALAVNNLAAQGLDISLADPAGLYLDGLVTVGMTTPDGTDPAAFWHVERGDPSHVVRARFEVPDGLDYRVSDVSIDGRPIEFGAQLAERVQVRLTAISKSGTSSPVTEPCL